MLNSDIETALLEHFAERFNSLEYPVSSHMLVNGLIINEASDNSIVLSIDKWTIAGNITIIVCYDGYKSDAGYFNVCDPNCVDSVVEYGVKLLERRRRD